MPDIVAFIPVRGGSKRIPDKNIKVLCQRPLLYWTLDAACKSEFLDRIIISTDSLEIIAISNYYNTSNIQNKISIIMRSSKTATDEATTESAMLEYFEHNQCDVIILLQATSPLTTAKNIDLAMSKFFNGEYDSLLSVARQKRFVWEINNSIAISSNYKVNKRPRSQDFTGYMVENGAIYITKYVNFIESGVRLSGKIGIYEMPEYTYLEIDDALDFAAVEAIKQELTK